MLSDLSKNSDLYSTPTQLVQIFIIFLSENPSSQTMKPFYAHDKGPIDSRVTRSSTWAIYNFSFGLLIMSP